MTVFVKHCEIYRQKVLHKSLVVLLFIIPHALLQVLLILQSSPMILILPLAFSTPVVACRVHVITHHGERQAVSTLWCLAICGSERLWQPGAVGAFSHCLSPLLEPFTAALKVSGSQEKAGHYTAKNSCAGVESTASAHIEPCRVLS